MSTSTSATISSSTVHRRRAKTSSHHLTTDLYYRSIYGQPTHAHYFYNKLSTNLSLHNLQFNLYPQIVSPHRYKISCLEIDNGSGGEGRFLLSGSMDCTVSVFDLSLLGSDYHLNQDDDDDDYDDSEDKDEGVNVNKKSLKKWKGKNCFRPIARSQRSFFTNNTSAQQNHLDPLHVPPGHSHSITQVKWYPIDSGIFISSDSIGNILMWDTNAFTPVSYLKKSGGMGGMGNGMGGYGYDVGGGGVGGTLGIASMDLPTLQSSIHMLLAIGCIQNGRTSKSKSHPYANNSSRSMNTSRAVTGSSALNVHMDDRVVYLCDIKSGNMTHSMAGHGPGGVQVVQWSPIHDYILASGSRDGTIKLWDVRKSGSTACLMTLDRDNSGRTTNELCFENAMGKGTSRTKLKKKRKRSKIAGPGDYSKVECSSYIQSHAGPVSNLSFTPDGNSIVSVSSTDGLRLWDVQSGKGSSTRYLHRLDKSQTQRRGVIPLRITQPGNFKTATVWIGGRDAKLYGYSISGDGGKANKILSGHLDDITAIASQDNIMRLFSGSRDGMILGFGNKNEFEPEY